MNTPIYFVLIMFILLILMGMITFIAWWLYPFNTPEVINRYELLYKYKIVDQFITTRDANKLIEQAKKKMKREQARFDLSELTPEMNRLVDKISKTLEVPCTSMDYILINKVNDENWDWDIPNDSVGVYISLNHKYAGGEIVFDDNTMIKLKSGQAIFFTEKSYSHCHRDVTKGEKWIVRVIVN